MLIQRNIISLGSAPEVKDKSTRGENDICINVCRPDPLLVYRELVQ